MGRPVTGMTGATGAGRWAAAALAVGLAVASPPVAAQEGELLTLHDRSWLCATPEDYAFALVRAEEAGPAGAAAVQAELLESKQCILIVEDDIEDIMAPFVEVLERRDGRAQVRFTVEFYKRIELLHRNITRATFSGWTGDDRLRNYHQWLTGKPQD